LEAKNFAIIFFASERFVFWKWLLCRLSRDHSQFILETIVSRFKGFSCSPELHLTSMMSKLKARPTKLFSNDDISFEQLLPNTSLVIFFAFGQSSFLNCRHLKSVNKCIYRFLTETLTRLSDWLIEVM